MNFSYIYNFIVNLVNSCFDANYDKCKDLVVSHLQNIHVPSFITRQITFISKLPLLETFILVDGIICSYVFLKDYLLLKFSEKRIGRTSKVIYDYKMDIIKKYNKIYTLNTLDRYIFYGSIYFYSRLFGYLSVFFDINFSEYANIQFYLLLLVVPYIQNGLMTLFKSPLDCYLENKEIFVKYSISKLIVSSIQNLHSDIDNIPNFHIFIIYSSLSFNYVYEIFKNYLFICLLYYLRNNDYLYFYYKAIKMAYFYHTGYNFAEMSLYDSVYLANLIVKEKRWNQLTKMEVVNMFYVLITSKFYDPYSNMYLSCSLLILQLFSLWSLVSLLKFTIYIPIQYKFIIASIILFFSLMYNVSNKLKKIITSVIVYYLILFNVNDIIITLVLISNNIVYYILEELYFFIYNIRSIRKVIRLYNKDKKKKTLKIDPNVTEKEFIFINGNNYLI